jgi:hypothetical protein
MPLLQSTNCAHDARFLDRVVGSMMSSSSCTVLVVDPYGPTSVTKISVSESRSCGGGAPFGAHVIAISASLRIAHRDYSRSMLVSVHALVPSQFSILGREYRPQDSICQPRKRRRQRGLAPQFEFLLFLLQKQLSARPSRPLPRPFLGRQFLSGLVHELPMED